MNVVAFADAKIAETKKQIEESTARFGPENNFTKALKVKYFKFKTSLNTYNNLGQIQKENAIKNRELPKLDIKSFHYSWLKKTTIGIAFGPSLADNIDHLSMIKSKYKLIACDKSMRWLFENGIIADAYTTIDAESPSEWIPDDINLAGKILFAHAGASHEFCVKFVRRGGYVSFYVHFCMIQSHLELAELAGVSDGLPVSGNVGHATVVIASDVLAAKKLILVGYDNSWRETQYYANKNEAADAVDSKFEEKRIGIDGREVFTNPGFLAYNHYLKEFIRDRKFEKRVINCSGSGLLNISLGDFKKY